MKTPWDKLSNLINSFTADNIEIAWPVIFKHLEKIKSGAHILDYGCGTGALCQELNRKGYAVTGIDTSEKLLEIARKQSSKKIDYIQGNQETLKKYQEKLDAITSVMVLQFIENIQQIAIAMYESLKQGGIVSIAVFNPKFVLRCSGQFFKRLNKSKTPWLAESHFDKIVVDTYIRNEIQYKKIFENAGFKFCSADYPPFTKQFLKKHEWSLPSDVPEYLIMKFVK